MTLAPSQTMDTITIKFPQEITVQKNFICKGSNLNLKSDLECVLIAADTIKVTLNFLPDQLTRKFSFQVINLINPRTTKPTNSFKIV